MAERLTPSQKVAAVLMTVSPSTAAAVIRNFSDKEIAVIGKEMQNRSKLSGAQMQAALLDFHRLAIGGPNQSGNSNIRQLLQSAFGRERASQLLVDMGLEDHSKDPFHALGELSPEELKHILAAELPQTAALILSHLDPEHAAEVVGLFPDELQVDIVQRMATVGEMSDDVIRRIDSILNGHLGATSQKRKAPAERRYKYVADVLNLLRRENEQQIMQKLKEQSPEVAENIRNFMFVFDDLRRLTDADVRKVLMSVDSQVLALALKTASEPLKQKIFANLSRRAAENVREEQEMLGLRPLSQVEAAQRQISEIVRNLEGSGQLTSRGGQKAEDRLV